MKHLLIDGNNLVMRSVFAGKGLQMSADGVHTAALSICLNMLSKHVREERPDTISVAFDSPGDIWRHQVYAEYKNTRRKHYDYDEVGPFSMVQEFLSLVWVHHVSRATWEADDIIAATWSSIRRRDSRDEVVILSGDKDMLQLLDTRTTQVRPVSGGAPTDRWDENRVTEHYGVPPRRLSRLNALVGDTSDNVPGVRGVGPKKARKMLEEHNWDLPSLAKAMHKAGKWSDDDVGDAQVSHLLVDLRDRDWTDHGRLTGHGLSMGVPPTYPVEVVPSPELISFLSRYRLAQIHSKIVAGSLWREVIQYQDMID